MTTTNTYWLHLLYEANYDDHPVVRVYRKYEDEEGNLDPDTNDVYDRYDFTDEDSKWLAEAFGQEEVDDLGTIDEWFGTDYSHFTQRLLPPTAQKYLSDLPPYEIASTSGN